MSWGAEGWTAGLWPAAIDKWLTAPVHHGHQVQAAPPCSACSQALRPLHNPQRALKTNPNPPTSAAKVARGTADLRRRPWNTNCEESNKMIMQLLWQPKGKTFEDPQSAKTAHHRAPHRQEPCRAEQVFLLGRIRASAGFASLTRWSSRRASRRATGWRSWPCWGGPVSTSTSTESTWPAWLRFTRYLVQRNFVNNRMDYSPLFVFDLHFSICLRVSCVTTIEMRVFVWGKH